MTAKTGRDMVLARNTGYLEAPVWVPLEEIGDVSLSGFTMNTAELKRRKKIGNKVIAAGLSPPEIEFRLHHGLDATNFDILRANFLAGTPELFGLLNGDPDTEACEGWHLPCIITEFPWDQPLEDISGHDVKLAYAYMERSVDGLAEPTEMDMEWIEVEAPEPSS